MQDLCSIFEQQNNESPEHGVYYNDDATEDSIKLSQEQLGISLGLADLIAEEENNGFHLATDDLLFNDEDINNNEMISIKSLNKFSNDNAPEFEKYVYNLCNI
jgi:hypothetical protein